MQAARAKNSREESGTRKQLVSSKTRGHSGATASQQQKATCAGSSKRADRSKANFQQTEPLDRLEEQTTGCSSKTKHAGDTSAGSNVIDRNRSMSAMEQRQQEPSRPSSSGSSSAQSRTANKPNGAKRRQQLFKERSRDLSQEGSSSSSQEMTTTNASSIPTDVTLTPMRGGNIVFEQETSLDDAIEGQNATDDDECSTLLESPRSKCAHVSRQTMQKTRPSSHLSRPESNAMASGSAQQEEHDIVLYHDDEEINYEESQRLAPIKFRAQQAPRPGADDHYELATTNHEHHADDDEAQADDDDNEELSNGAALTMADDDQLTTVHSEEISFVVHPLGCCEFDETQLVSSTSTRAIQKCILRLSNRASQEESNCWGLGQSQPILMRLLEEHIQFTDIGSQTLLSSQPIVAIKSWAVDDDNNFAFVVEEAPLASSGSPAGQSSVDYALLNGPAFMCYAFRSFDDDDMSCKVAVKLNADMERCRHRLASRAAEGSRLRRMIVVEPHQAPPLNEPTDELAATDLDAEDLDELDELGTANELTMNVKYMGKVQVARPMGIDVLNVAIDTCLAEAGNRSITRPAEQATSAGEPLAATPAPDETPDRSGKTESALISAKLHVSPSSVIVENAETGSIIVECRIRFLTFIGISRRDIRWCGFIMQNTTNKSFVAHCFECQPTAGHVCEAIQASCSRMYEKMLRGQRTKRQQQEDATTSIMPNGSKIRDTLAKTLSKIRLTPII